MKSLNMEEITTQIQTVFESNTKILSFNTLRRRFNNNRNKNKQDRLTSKQLSNVLVNSECFTRANPITIGSHKWYDERHFNNKNLQHSERTRSRINLWKMC